MDDLGALRSRRGKIGGQSLGGADIPRRSDGRTVPRHLRFHCECHGQQTKAGSKQDAAQSGQSGATAKHIRAVYHAELCVPRSRGIQNEHGPRAHEPPQGPEFETQDGANWQHRILSVHRGAAIVGCGFAARNLNGDGRRIPQRVVHQAVLY